MVFARALLRRALPLPLAVVVFALAGPARAQTPDDGVMLNRGLLCTGVLYSHDSWNAYWEGSLKRTNGNLGTVTTQSVNNSSNFAILNRLNVFATTPYVWSHTSQGVLRGMQGFQDISLAVKYQALRIPLHDVGDLRVIGGVSGSLPLTNYEADLQPVSIGLHSKTIAPRATVNFQMNEGPFVNVTADYAFRDVVTLEVPYYYTNGQLYLTNQVSMPNQLQYNISAGYLKRDLMFSGEFIQQQTRGGGDIRRQDMPFISNRMNASRAELNTHIPIPRVRNLQAWFAYAFTFTGRNVGQSSAITTGFMYTVHFRRDAAK
jgi:hypothetical protein